MDLSPLKDPIPRILERRRHRVSRFFTVDELDLEFSNHEKRTYERLSGGHGAILAVPFDGSHFYLTSEYACGFERYELGFVKGKIDAAETPEQACNRELEEEIGYSTSHVELLRDEMTVAPGMLSLKMYTFLCTGLKPQRISSGDEPEPIRLIRADPREARQLLFDPASPLKEARSIACLALAMHHLDLL